MSEQDDIRKAIEHEEQFVRTLRSHPFKYLMAAALHRATGIQGGVTSPDGLPHLIAEGVIAYLAAAVEQATDVRRRFLSERDDLRRVPEEARKARTAEDALREMR